MVVPYSITLIFPLAIALGIWLLLGQIRQPIKVIVSGAVVGSLCMLVLIKVQVFAGSSRHIAMSFDHGQFSSKRFVFDDASVAAGWDGGETVARSVI